MSKYNSRILLFIGILLTMHLTVSTAAPEHNPDEQDVVQEEYCQGGVYHGSIIALPVLYNKYNYLGCAGAKCGRATCPRLYMEGSDWTRCWGEVFTIYRRAGRGSVKVGDEVGLHYPRENGAWFGCAGKKCNKAPCPGVPTAEFGFSDASKWTSCWGEVYRIYARGKGVGEDIRPKDSIMLYYQKGNNWVGLADKYADHRGCPGNTLPPSDDKYDQCWGEVFEIVVNDHYSN